MQKALYIRLYDQNPDLKQIRKVVEILKLGGLVIYPTDTVYGMGCDITNAKAIDRLAKIKGTKAHQRNWSFICADLSDLSDYTRQIDTPSFKILKKTLPGPYTYILNGNNNLPKIFRKRKTVGIRIPDNNIARELVRELGRPIISTSLKDKDEILEYTTDPERIFENWQYLVDVVIDAGAGGNEPSTVVDLTSDQPRVIRDGKGDLDFL